MYKKFGFTIFPDLWEYKNWNFNGYRFHLGLCFEIYKRD